MAHAGDIGNPAESEGRGFRPLRRFLRFSLYHKIVAANSLFVAIAALVATALTLRTMGMEGTALTLAAVAASVVVVIVATAAANAYLVRVALSSLDPLERTARRVEAGDLTARCGPSPLADAQIERLTTVFNEMLEGLEEGRRRQQDLAVTVLKAEERERMWLARELYDDTAQTLATTLLHLRAATRDRGSDYGEALEAVRAEIVDALDGIRRVARRLRPPEIDELGLAAAIVAQARALSEVSGVPIATQIDAVDDVLSREGRVALYRILQESLNNAVRHGDPEHVRIEMSRQPSGIVTRVIDDGKGFDPDLVVPSNLGTFGLVGIRERASYLGGHATVASSPGAGTTIRIDIPLPDSMPMEQPACT